MDRIAEDYNGGVCPDCYTTIPDDAYWGGECWNCGHVWNKPEETMQEGNTGFVQQIYAVYATDVERNYLLDYAIGHPDDIREVYDDRKGYGLELKEVKPVVITSEIAQEIRSLRNQKVVAQSKITEIESKLKKLGVKS
jgi:hypothetical protein